MNYTINVHKPEYGYCDMSDTKKRTHSDVECHSSPENPTTKKVFTNYLCSMEDTELKQTIEIMSKQLQGLVGTKELCQDLQSSFADLLTQLKTTQDRCDRAEAKLLQCEHDNQLLRQRMESLEKKAIYAESYSRRSNLLFDGISQTPNEDIESKVRQVLAVNMKLENVHDIQFVRVHRLRNTTKIIARFERFKDKDRVWRARRNLKGSNIWIEEDFPKEIRQRRQVLQPIYLQALKTPDVKASLIEDRLIVNNQTFTVENLQQLPPALSLEKSSLAVRGDQIFFYSRSSPLSNFFPSTLTVNGVSYKNAEQYYQGTRADLHKNNKLYDQIMLATDPAEMYHLGSKVLMSDPNVWTDGRKKKVMEDALLAKFEQNLHLKHVLLSTGDKILV